MLSLFLENNYSQITTFLSKFFILHYNYLIFFLFLYTHPDKHNFIIFEKKNKIK